MLLCVAGTALTVRAQKVTLNFRNAKLEQVFGRITEQTGYTFYYARPTVNPTRSSASPSRMSTCVRR